ncbi:sulfotransferase family protein [Alteromonas lipolytica]|uniref:Sulfotransferase domain-containing protein n=1 Tax=Alteromonas lipolytica TaxID=1856405 RepID=A0A1E8FC34_9ALTE|nr:sulfotransferase [Alteromonas lipolytica]OFI33063.1 hypothetical protein BFC17_01985 [Alteromonas lipolytica]GGF62819.1 hypothetical protein GCM10011338_14100 [Alteromonas lipolytica]
MKPLDFLIIGAQKSGTTSLFKYLNQHPDIAMPADKEAPYFTNDSLYNAGWQAYLDNYFGGASPNQLWGTASPQYMSDLTAASRITRDLPDTRLVAILRNPIDRAYSHYLMQKRRGLDQRSFDAAVDTLLQQDRVSHAREHQPVFNTEMNYEDESGHYLVLGEYGRILHTYRHFFARNQILVLFMDELTERPHETVTRVLEFIGADSHNVPDNVGKVYHQGGGKQIIPNAWRNQLKTSGLFRVFWDRIPERTKSSIRYWYDQKNVRKEQDKSGPSEQAKQRLAEFYRGDIQQLQTLTNQAVPWSEFQAE